MDSDRICLVPRDNAYVHVTKQLADNMGPCWNLGLVAVFSYIFANNSDHQ
jgi:hypothetical protein